MKRSVRGCISRLVMDWFPSMVEKIVVKLGCPPFPENHRVWIPYVLVGQITVILGYVFLFAYAFLQS